MGNHNPPLTETDPDALALAFADRLAAAGERTKIGDIRHLAEKVASANSGPSGGLAAFLGVGGATQPSFSGREKRMLAAIERVGEAKAAAAHRGSIDVLADALTERQAHGHAPRRPDPTHDESRSELARMFE